MRFEISSACVASSTPCRKTSLFISCRMQYPVVAHIIVSYHCSVSVWQTWWWWWWWWWWGTPQRIFTEHRKDGVVHAAFAVPGVGGPKFAHGMQIKISDKPVQSLWPRQKSCLGWTAWVPLLQTNSNSLGHNRTICLN